MAKSNSPWVTTTALAQELGCAPKHIRNTLKDDVFRQGYKRGEYYVINPHAWRPTYRWHLGRCIKRLDEVAGGDRVG